MSKFNFMSLANILSRVVLAATIIWIVVPNLQDTSLVIGYAQLKGVPLANILAPFAQVLLGISSFFILTGIKPKLGLLAFMAFLLGVTPLMHQWWLLKDFDRMVEMKYFQSNLMLFTLAGILLSGDTDNWPYTLKWLINPSRQ